MEIRENVCILIFQFIYFRYYLHLNINDFLIAFCLYFDSHNISMLMIAFNDYVVAVIFAAIFFLLLPFLFLFLCAF